MRLYELGQLFALPIQSAVRAQVLASQEAISFMEQLGLEKGVAKTWRFKVERMVEERKIHPKTGIAETHFKVEPLEVSVPLLAIVNPPTVKLQELNVEFGVDVVIPRAQAIRSNVVPSTVLGSSLAASLSHFTSLSESRPTTIKVNMKIVREIPEGLARLEDLLTDLLNGRTEKGPMLDEIQGLPINIATMLRDRGIFTVDSFLAASEASSARTELVKEFGVSARTMAVWRKEAKRLLEMRK